MEACISHELFSYVVVLFKLKTKHWRLLRKMYEKVENKVIFGDFESDWFDQEFGLKQV
jgi:hypothetical protein